VLRVIRVARLLQMPAAAQAAGCLYLRVSFVYKQAISEPMLGRHMSVYFHTWTRPRLERCIHDPKFAYLTATLATSEESRPPDSSTPKGASDMSRFTTLLTKVSCRHGNHHTVDVNYQTVELVCGYSQGVRANLRISKEQ